MTRDFWREHSVCVYNQLLSSLKMAASIQCRRLSLYFSLPPPLNILQIIQTKPKKRLKAPMNNDAHEMRFLFVQTHQYIGSTNSAIRMYVCACVYNECMQKFCHCVRVGSAKWLTEWLSEWVSACVSMCVCLCVLVLLPLRSGAKGNGQLATSN